MTPIDPDLIAYETGAKRSERLPRYDLIVGEFLRRVAERCTGELREGHPTGGALKYGEGNWERGLPTSDVINHIIEHLHAVQEEFRRLLTLAATDIDDTPWSQRMEIVRQGVDKFLEADDALAGAAWGIMVLMHQQRTKFFHDDAF
jgi:hypothetical protein